ncbi:MAG: hypothetical protein Q9176_001721 [Flavoplaca citrina]
MHQSKITTASRERQRSRSSKPEAAADALNGTPEAEITEQVAARATAIVIQEQNQLWAANRNGLHVFVDSEKSKAKQEIKEAGSETRASIQRSWDLELQRSRAMPHELLDLIEQATQDCEMYNSIAS